MNKEVRRLLVALTLLLMLGEGAHGFPLEAAVGVDVQSWKLEGGDGAADIEQVVTPLWIHGLPVPSLEFWLYAGYAFSSLSRRADGDLQSLDNVTVSLDWQPGPRGLHLLGGVGVGPDSPSFSEGDRILATLLAEPVLQWSVPIHGSGADARLGLLYARPTPLGSATLGVLWTRFDSYETGLGRSFDPADELRLSGAYQVSRGEALGRLDVSWLSGGESQLGERRIFETGGRWEVSLQGEMGGEALRLSALLGTRGYTSADVEALPGSLQEIEAANLWTGNVRIARAVRGWGGSLGASFISSPDAPTGQNGGVTWRAEAALTRAVGRWGVVSLDGGPSWGELDNGGSTRGWRVRFLLFLRSAGSSSPGSGLNGE